MSGTTKNTLTPLEMLKFLAFLQIPENLKEFEDYTKHAEALYDNDGRPKRTHKKAASVSAFEGRREYIRRLLEKADIPAYDVTRLRAFYTNWKRKKDD